uniref:Uncharacterized protein n=1 Tax=Panagrolaimus sp. JU765 TaxID=591449 RepID=A0AC34RAC7_9BILA
MFSIAGKTINDKCTGVCEPVDRKGLLNPKGKNAKQIVCRRCQSLIFPQNVAIIVKTPTKEIQNMTVGGTVGTGSQKISEWWYTESDLDFDTVGWQTVDNVKCLMCGDCEFGPFGWRTDDNKKFYEWDVKKQNQRRKSPFEESDDWILWIPSDEEFADFIEEKHEKTGAGSYQPGINGHRSAAEPLVDGRHVDHDADQSDGDKHGDDGLPIAENAVGEDGLTTSSGIEDVEKLSNDDSHLPGRTSLSVDVKLLFPWKMVAV